MRNTKNSSKHKYRNCKRSDKSHNAKIVDRNSASKRPGVFSAADHDAGEKRLRTVGSPVQDVQSKLEVGLPRVEAGVGCQGVGEFWEVNI